MSAKNAVLLPLTAVVTACLLHTGIAGPAAASPAASQASFRLAADNYPYQGQSGFTVIGKILTVDAARDLVTLRADDGSTYTVDTMGSQINLKVSSTPGDVDDLQRDMRVHVSGNLLSGNLIAANRVQVLPNVTPTTVSSKIIPRTTVMTEQRLPIALRGTVVSVDNSEGSFDVHVQDHKRTIYVSGQTRFPNIFVPGKDVPLHPGDRVSVDGKLEPDGTVSAAVVHMVQPIKDVHELIGKVTTQSNSLYTRDLQIKLDSGPVIKVSVPRDIPINSGDDSISVHDLTTDDVIKIDGAFDGDKFVASSIDVLQPEVTASN